MDNSNVVALSRLPIKFNGLILFKYGAVCVCTFFFINFLTTNFRFTADIDIYFEINKKIKRYTYYISVCGVENITKNCAR